MSDDEVVAVLAYAIGEGFPAAPHCLRLLDERPEWALPDVRAARPPAVLAPRVADEEMRAQRRARRAERKRAPSSPPPPRRVRAAKASDPPRGRVATPPTEVAETVPAVTRRRMALTPAESARFDPDHPLVGAIVMVELPFDAVDPDQPEVRSKERPALVVAASGDAVLVRGIFSSPSTTRSLFAPWRRAGLDHPSYLDVARVALTVSDQGTLNRVGRVTDEEWNATF